MSLLQKLVKDLSLLAELHSLRKQLRTLQSVYELTVSDRDKKIADLEKQLEATKYYTNQYQKAVYRGIDYNDQLVEENESLKEQLQTAISNYDERDHHYTTLEAAHIKLGAELDKSEQEIAKLTREKETLEVEGTDFINVLRSKNEDIDNLKAEVQIAEDDFDEMANLYTNLHKAFDDLVDTNADLVEVTKHCNQLETAIENQNATIAKRAEQLRVSNNEIIALKEQCRAATVECNKRDTEYKTLSEQYDKLHKVNESLTTRIAGLQLEKSTLHQRLTTEKDSLSNTLAEVVAKNEQLENRISALINDNAGLREEVIKTKFYNSQLSNENSRLKAENESLTKNLAANTTGDNMLVDLMANLRLTEVANKELNTKYSTLKNSYDSLQAEATQLEQETLHLKTELQTANNEIIALKEQLQSFNTERGFRATEYKILSEQYDKLHKANEALTAEIARLEQSKYPIYEKLVADKANSDQALAKIMLEKNQLDREHRALKLNYDNLQSELLIKNQHLETQLSTALKDYDTYKALATHNHKNNLRLIDKVKAIHDVVKVLEPISMKFQTVLFDLLADANVPRT